MEEKLTKKGLPDKRYGKKKTASEKSDDSINNNQQATNLTPEERAIADRVAKKDDSWVITEGDIYNLSLSDDPYTLPPEAQKKQDDKEFAFRVFEMNTKRLDEVASWPRPKKWWVCNRINCPWLSDKHFDSIHGGVQIQDQLLHFKPWKDHAKYQGLKMDAIQMRQDAADINKRDGVKIDEGEWKAGEEAKIGGKDEVIIDTSTLDAQDMSEGLEDVAA